MVTSVTRILSSALLALAAGCSRHVNEAFAVRNAQPAYPDIAMLAEREPVPRGSIGGSLALHRLQRGNDMWVFGVREFEGPYFGGTDREVFTKVTVVFATASKPEGKFTVDGQQVRLFYSAGSHMLGARPGCYASASSGAVEVSWQNADEFRLQVQTDIPASQIYPRSTQCPQTPLRIDVKARLRPYDELGPWEGVPVSLALDGDASTLDEAWPR